LMTACPPIQRSFPIERGAPNSRSERLVSMSSGWVAAYSPTFGLGGMVRESSGEPNRPLRLQSIHSPKAAAGFISPQDLRPVTERTS
jgi:hypothetical protein